MKAVSIAAAIGATVLVTASLARADMDTQSRPVTRDMSNMHEDAQKGGDPNANSGPHMSSAVSKLVKAVVDAGGKKDWTTAKAKLAEARALSGLTDFDLFELDVVTGFVAVNTGDHPGALASYKKEIANPLFATALSKGDQVGTVKNAMVLSNEATDYPGTIALGQTLMSIGPLDTSAAITMALAYYAKGDYAMAQSLAQKAIDADVAAGKTPNPTAAEIVVKSKAAQH